MQLFECLNICWLLWHGAGHIHIFYSHLLLSFSSTRTQVTLFFELSQQLSRRFCKMKFFRPFFVVPLRQKHATVNATTWFLFIYYFFEAGVHRGLREWLRLGLEGKKQPINVPLLVFEKWCAMRWRASQCHWRCAECWKNNPNASIFKRCCLHVCTCTESS